MHFFVNKSIVEKAETKEYLQPREDPTREYHWVQSKPSRKDRIENTSRF